jgi:hypothetical protein
LKVSLNSQFIYSGDSGAFYRRLRQGSMAKSDDVLDPVLVWLDGVPTATLSLNRNRTRQGLCHLTAKIPLAKFSFHATLWTRGEFVP